jgi:uncharacterized protein (TIGR00369 family)
MTLLDSAAGAAVHSTLGERCGYTTLETKVNLVRAVLPRTGPLLAEGSVVHRGRTVATAESRLLTEDGTLYAHATSTCLILQDSGRRQPPNAAVGSARPDTSKV